ncbi:MAG TPA: universal stress protein [Micromonosporaceae bacterium]
MTEPVIAGVDGSKASQVAAGQAADAALRRRAPLLLVHGYLHPFRYGVPIDPYAFQLPPPSDEAIRMLDEVAAELRRERPGLTVETRQVAGGPAAALVELSQEARLVVVGSRGHGGFTGLLLGSVSAQVASHAHCPVLVVRPADLPPPKTGPVVVGVDGSAGSGPALAFAAEEAALRGSPLTVLHVWGDAPRDGATVRDEAQRLLDEAVAEARERHPGLTVEGRAVTGLDPERALIEASGKASLVVVGSRGRGGFTGLLLGSVSQALVHHSGCPVVIARPHHHQKGD